MANRLGKTIIGTAAERPTSSNEFKGTIYVTTDTDKIYRNSGAAWVEVGGGTGSAHDLLDGSQNQDTLAGSVVDGDIIIGNGTPKWSRLARSVPGGAALLNVLGMVTGETRPSWKALFDATNPVSQNYGDSASPGTATVAAHRDHTHGMPASAGASFATPTVALGSAAAAGAASTVIRSDSTIAAFDATNPSTQAFADAAVVGTAAFAARRDHKHAMPSVPVRHGCDLSKAAVQSISDSTTTALQFDTETEDTDGYHDNSTQNTRVTIPSGLGGMYAIVAQVDWGSSSTGKRVLDVRVNGTTFINSSSITPSAADATPNHEVMALCPLVAGDYVEITSFQNSGGSRNATAKARFYLVSA